MNFIEAFNAAEVGVSICIKEGACTWSFTKENYETAAERGYEIVNFLYNKCPGKFIESNCWCIVKPKVKKVGYINIYPYDKNNRVTKHIFSDRDLCKERAFEHALAKGVKIEWEE